MHDRITKDAGNLMSRRDIDHSPNGGVRVWTPICIPDGGRAVRQFEQLLVVRYRLIFQLIPLHGERREIIEGKVRAARAGIGRRQSCEYCSPQNGCVLYIGDLRSLEIRLPEWLVSGLDCVDLGLQPLASDACPEAPANRGYGQNSKD
jgi:hypothetical protein